jgi:asparagine synthase (glutamine-hydrolysing)
VCGIAGAIAQEVLEEDIVRRGIEKIAHRGPDNRGYYDSQKIQLGMCRLAIQDLENGIQPNYSEDKKVVSVFNGEIYNFRTLRAELITRGYKLNSHGDAELIPHLFKEYGMDFVRRIEGMFAIAIFNLELNQLILIRDRIGKKPLWYSANEQSIYFASEMKALVAMGVSSKASLKRIPEYLTFGYINAPNSSFENIYQVEPGTYLTWQNGDKKIKKYWSIFNNTYSSELTDHEAKVATKELLTNAVRNRLISDRPVGAFLSGGIDSTIVTALMSQLNDEPIHTFSVGFESAPFDESAYARKVAQALGTVHHEIMVRPNGDELVRKLSKVLDQPFADSSIIPTLALSEFAREHVVVALSGDGGDEGFGGYDRYRANYLMERFGLLSSKIAIGATKTRFFSRAKRISRFLESAMIRDGAERYLSYMSLLEYPDMSSLVNKDLLDSNYLEAYFDLWEDVIERDITSTMQRHDISSYLPGDLMYKVDMASMSVGLEVRSPFLDHKVIEFGLSLSRRQRVRASHGKHILRILADELVPSNNNYRRKQGFGIPRAEWLRTILREPVRQVLLDDAVRKRGWINVDALERVLKRHEEGENLDKVIWPIFMLELWASKWVK